MRANASVGQAPAKRDARGCEGNPGDQPTVDHLQVGSAQRKTAEGVNSCLFSAAAIRHASSKLSAG
jgi:hypothetical protein